MKTAIEHELGNLSMRLRQAQLPGRRASPHLPGDKSARIVQLKMFGLLAGIAIFLAASPRPRMTASQGYAAPKVPDFSIMANDGMTYTPDYLKGNVVLIMFWATWCPPCVQEVPDLVALQKQEGDKVVILAVSMDEDEAAYKEFTAKNMPGILTVRDPDHKSSSIYGTFAYPETYLIDRNGKIERKFIGAVDWTSPEMLDYFNKL